MLIDPQHEGSPCLDFETWERNSASVARDRLPEVGMAAGILGSAAGLGSEQAPGARWHLRGRNPFSLHSEASESAPAAAELAELSAFFCPALDNRLHLRNAYLKHGRLP